VILKEDRNACLADFSFSYANDEIDEFILVGADFDPIRVQECKRGRECRTFVAVNEGMIAADAMEVCGCHLEDRLVKENASEGCLDVSHCRQKKACVTNAGGSSEQPDLFFVSDENLVKSEEKNLHF
jgi:hypothetical protein